MQRCVTLDVLLQQLTQQMANRTWTSRPYGTIVELHRCQDIEGCAKKQELIAAVGLFLSDVIEHHPFEFALINQGFGQLCNPTNRGSFKDPVELGKLEDSVCCYYTDVFR